MSHEIAMLEERLLARRGMGTAGEGLVVGGGLVVLTASWAVGLGLGAMFGMAALEGFGVIPASKDSFRRAALVGGGVAVTTGVVGLIASGAGGAYVASRPS